MISRLALIACTALSIGGVLPAAAAEVGVGIGPAGAGVTVRGDRDHDRDKTVIVNPDRDRAERDKTVVINKDRDRDSDRNRDSVVIKHLRASLISSKELPRAHHSARGFSPRFAFP
jgi:hypothetical protein